jgi:translation initiation factor 3 subunit C
MSHLQDNIANVGDISTMILFNRMMVTLGLSAFRQGRIKDAHQCLSEICSGRFRELLAQGVATGRFVTERSVEEEKAQKRRQIPYHQHINVDLLEACHLISAMLLEVPNITAGGDDANGVRKSKIISRTFRKNYDNYERQVFTGPPEQTRDYVMRASKSLMKGDWRACSDLIVNLEVWKLIPGEDSVHHIQSMLLEKIKLEGLRTYLFSFATHYDSLSLNQLCGMFQMSKNEIHSIVSKMMINDELHATWDQLTETIVLRRVEPSNLQLLALQFAEKASVLVDANERLLDAKSGIYFHRDTEGYWKSGDQKDGGRGGSQMNMRRSGAPSGRFPSGRVATGRGRGGRGGMRQQGGRRSSRA